MCLKKYLCKGKIRLNTEHFLLKISFNKPSFCQTLTTFGFRCRIISVKILVFAVKILPQKIHFLLKFTNNKCSIYNNKWQVTKDFTNVSDSVPPMTVFHNSVKFLACFYKIAT